MEETDGFIPLIVRSKAKSMGSEGEKWLMQVHSMFRELEQHWDIRYIKTLKGGSEALVTEVAAKDGEKVILKLAIPQMEGNSVFEQELEALQLVDGNGYVRLLKEDSSRRALLLERLGPILSQSGYSPQEEMEIICATLMKTWKPVPQPHNLQTYESLIHWFKTFIPQLWLEIGKPCSEEIIAQALAYLEIRWNRMDFRAAVLVHGDAHNENILQNPGEPQPSFKLIDPDGLIAEPAYDLGVLMREWPEEMAGDPLEKGRVRCRLLSQLTGIEPEAIWEWGFIQVVSTGLLLMKTGRQEEGFQLLEVAGKWKGEKC